MTVQKISHRMSKLGTALRMYAFYEYKKRGVPKGFSFEKIM